ncbi:MAG: hypothetical protein HZB79_08345 [Deltaproteobacteria bacterium]|nr:hypothetical protein [Deltaproteobacteria bacterium]MBI5893642.1 hypothetical protein [Deltaproteobacteria bacterium]
MQRYWERPIPFQNTKFPLYPDACGECHKDQHENWKDSLHSRAVGPGLLGQLGKDFKSVPTNPESSMSCYFCHAPMTEQAEVKTGAMGKGQGASNYIKNQSFDNRLKLSGVSCSVCHLRKGKVYGPQKREVRSQKSEVRNKRQNAHDGFIEKAFFEKAEFCAACHQLDEGYELNGKVLTNTYREWKESIYGKNNVTCQNCHMPDRQHLWRGIHNPEMVKKGITIDAVREGKKAKIVITNTGVGHYFPTYTTPIVVVKGYMQDNNGSAIPESVKVRYIGRRVSLDLSNEFFDTRISPQGKFEFTYEIKKLYNKNKSVFEVWVYPDDFYNRFYKELLKGDDKNLNRKEIEEALKITEESGYQLFRENL